MEVIAWIPSLFGRRALIMELIARDSLVCVLLLFSASAISDTGSKSFDCALVPTLEIYDDPDS
jgi:hypothetical protein